MNCRIGGWIISTVYFIQEEKDKLLFVKLEQIMHRRVNDDWAADSKSFQFSNMILNQGLLIDCDLLSFY